MNLTKLNSIGSGAYFPIKLTTVLKEDGTPDKVVLPDGSLVDKVTWQPLFGSMDLIKQNITAILVFQLGQRFRQEEFGSRTWECIEEPNTQALSFMIRDFIKDGISSWEPRVKAMNTLVTRTQEGVHIELYFTLNDNQNIEEISFDYNPNNDLTYVSE